MNFFAYEVFFLPISKSDTRSIGGELALSTGNGLASKSHGVYQGVYGNKDHARLGHSLRLIQT